MIEAGVQGAHEKDVITFPEWEAPTPLLTAIARPPRPTNFGTPLGGGGCQ